MVSTCIVPGCRAATGKKNSGISYYRLPAKDPERCKQWLKAVSNPKYGDTSPTESLINLRVCSLHFKREDFQPSFFCESMGNTGVKKLKETAIPSVHLDEEEPQPPALLPAAKQSCLQLHNYCKEMGQSLGQFRSTGIQVNLLETESETMEKPSRQYIVDEEAIVQLMQNCPMCKRKCRCRKRTHGTCVVFYQGCYFCDYRRKWASQPEASNISIHKTHTQPKKKRPKDKVSVKAKTQSSQVKEKTVAESSVLESHDPLETGETLPTLT